MLNESQGRRTGGTNGRGRRAQASQEGRSVQGAGSGTLVLRLAPSDRPLTALATDEGSNRFRFVLMPPLCSCPHEGRRNARGWASRGQSAIWVHAFGRTSGLAWKAVACLSRIDNQDSHAENGKAGADIVMGSPILSALLRPRHRLHSRKPPMARHASDCTGCQHFDAPHAWSHGALGRTGRGSSDRHVTSSAPLR